MKSEIKNNFLILNFIIGLLIVLIAGCGDESNVTTTNVYLKLNPDNPSYHPVESEGKNAFVPSLIKPYTERYEESGDISIIKCTDCHSIEGYSSTILNYDTTGGPEYPEKYELCYSCHKRSIILADMSFSWHALHIKIADASCYACHDSHGSMDYTHLIRFDTDLVTPDSSGSLLFVDKGDFRGACSLTCHGTEHNELVHKY